jgi:hypothetical protein
MIPVALAPEPATFDVKVRQPGLRAIAELCGKQPKVKRRPGKPFQKLRGVSQERDIPPEKFPDYWVQSLDDLMKEYHQICAYSCFVIHRVTGARSADHFVAKSRNWRHVYEWSNYQLCCGRLNSRKADIGSVLDPFKIQPGWFQLELLGFQVHPDRMLPKATQAKIQRTIDRLGLNDFRHDRERDAERYWERGRDPREGISLKILKEESPFVAFELYRQGRLNAGDVW